MHAIKSKESVQLNNELVYNCSKEELLELAAKYKFDEAFNYNMMVALPPQREQTKSGLFIPQDNSETEQFRTSIGRIISIGSSVGSTEALKDCRDLKVGDYVKYAFYAAGTPENYKGIRIKFVVDDQVKARIANPEDLDKLYDY